MLTVVTGPPCSGKSHYIRQRAKHGDVVIDLDHLAAALTPTDDVHDYPEHVRTVARRARRAALDAAIPLTTRGVRVWVVDTAPSKDMRAFYHRHRADIVRLTVTASDFSARVVERSAAAQRHARSLI